MRRYKLVSKRGEGSFAEVIKAQNIDNGKFYAVKCMKRKFRNIDKVNNLREIKALRRLSPHPNIISLEEVLFDAPTGRLALVFELMHDNLYEAIKDRRSHLGTKIVKSYMHQLYRALDHMHSNGIFHRDIKPENILLDESGRHLKLADLGSCRGIYNKQPYTEYISTRWYRAPECLLTDGYYGPEMDIWATGCVLFEVISLYPLFPGTDELDTLNRIHKILGSPPQQVLNDLVLQGKASAHMNFDFPSQKGAGIGHLIPHAPPDCVDLLTRSLRYELKDRISARGSINHPYFSEFRDSDLESQARSCQLSRSGAGQQSTSDVERVKHTANAAYSSTASLARIATKSDPGTSSSSMPLERSQACNVPQQQHRPMLLSIETGEYAEIKKSSLSELPLPGVEEETSIPHPPPKHTAHRKKHQIPDNMSTHGTLSRKSTTDRKLTNPNTNINQASSRRSTMPGKHLAHQSIQSKSSLPALKSQRKSSLPKLGAASSSCEVSGTTKRSSHIKNTVGGSYDRRKSESSRNNSYSHVRSSGYGKSNKIPQNKRYSHITSSGYGQSTSSTHSRNSIAAGNIGAVKSGGVGARSSLPSIGQYSTRPRGVVARTGAVRIRSRT